MSINKSIELTICGVGLSYVAISAIFPLLDGYMGPMNNIVCFAINIAMFVVALNNSEKSFYNKKHLAFSIVWILMIMIPFIIGNSTITNRYLSLLSFVTVPLIYNYLINSGKERLLKRIVLVILIFSAITFVITSFRLYDSPYLARSIKSEGAETQILKRQGIGGYEFTYFVLFMFVVAINTFKIKKKLIYIAMSIIIILHIVLSNYYTALLLTFLALFLTLFDKKKALRNIMILLTLVIILINIEQLFEMVSSIIKYLSPDGAVANRISIIDGSAISGIVNDFSLDRLPRIIKSIKLTENSLAFGAAYIPLFSQDELLRLLGNHSYFFDTMALLGIPMLAISMYLFLLPLRNSMVLKVILIIMMIINNLTPSIAIAVYLIFAISNINTSPNREEISDSVVDVPRGIISLDLHKTTQSRGKGKKTIDPTGPK